MWKKILKISAASVLVLLTFISVVVLSLRSPAVMQRILSPVQQVLERDYNLKSQISQLAIDPFARVVLEGFDAQWSDPKIGKARAKVGRVLIRFSFWQLLQRRLQISAIEVNKPEVEFDIVLAEKAEASPAENPLPLLRKLMTDPPLALHLDSIKVNDLSLRGGLKVGSSHLSFSADHIHLQTDLSVVPRNFSAALKLLLGKKSGGNVQQSTLKLNALGFSPAAPELALEVPLDFLLSTDLSLRFPENSPPEIHWGESNLQMAADSSTAFAKLADKARADVSWRSLVIDMVKRDPTSLQLASVFELEKTSGAEFFAQLPQKILTLVGSLGMQVKAQISLKGLKLAARLPNEKMDVDTVLSLDLPLQINLSGKEYVLTSGELPLSFSLDDIRLQGAAWKTLQQFMNVGELQGMKLQTPFQMTLSPPNYKDAAKPLAGLRFDALTLKPELRLKSYSETFFTSQISASHKGTGEIELNIALSALLREALLKLAPQLKPLPDAVGWLDIAALLEVRLKTGWQDVQAVLESPHKEIKTADLKYDLKMNQFKPPPASAPLALQFPGGIQIAGDVKVQQPMALQSAQVRAKIDWDKRPILTSTIDIKNPARKFSIAGKTQVEAPLRLRQMTAAAEALGMLGGTRLEADWKVEIPHAASSLLKAVLPAPLLMNADLSARAKVEFTEKPVRPLFDGARLQLGGPLDASVSVALRQGLAKGSVTYRLPRVGVSELAMVENIDGTLKFETKTDLQSVVKVQVNNGIGAVVPAKELGLPPEVLPYLKKVRATVRAQSDLKQRVDLEQADVAIGGDLLSAQVRGGTDLKGTNSRFDGQLSVRPPPVYRYGIRAQDKVSLDGLIKVGWELTQKEQKALRLRGHLNLVNFAAQHSLGGLKKAFGRIPFQQDLELPNFKSLRWAYLIRDNPFKRVDTSKFVPLTLDDSLVTIGELNALERNFGPLRARLSLQQNMLTIDKLDADLFEGVLAGQGFIDIQPSRLMAGLQGRITKLNANLLSKRADQSQAAPLSARLALVVDLAKSLVEGRVDVTEIGRNQLLALIDVLDPSGADPLLNKARLGLGVGYPRFVGLQMQQGYLDLDVGIGGVVDQNIKIGNLPLTPIINAKTQDLVKTIREVPIQ